VFSFPFSFQFFTRLAAVFAEEVGLVAILPFSKRLIRRFVAEDCSFAHSPDPPTTKQTKNELSAFIDKRNPSRHPLALVIQLFSSSP